MPTAIEFAVPRLEPKSRTKGAMNSQTPAARFSHSASTWSKLSSK